MKHSVDKGFQSIGNKERNCLNRQPINKIFNINEIFTELFSYEVVLTLNSKNFDCM